MVNYKWLFFATSHCNTAVGHDITIGHVWLREVFLALSLEACVLSDFHSAISSAGMRPTSFMTLESLSCLFLLSSSGHDSKAIVQDLEIR